MTPADPDDGSRQRRRIRLLPTLPLPTVHPYPESSPVPATVIDLIVAEHPANLARLLELRLAAQPAGESWRVWKEGASLCPCCTGSLTLRHWLGRQGRVDRVLLPLQQDGHAVRSLDALLAPGFGRTLRMGEIIALASAGLTVAPAIASLLLTAFDERAAGTAPVLSPARRPAPAPALSPAPALAPPWPRTVPAACEAWAPWRAQALVPAAALQRHAQGVGPWQLAFTWPAERVFERRRVLQLLESLQALSALQSAGFWIRTRREWYACVAQIPGYGGRLQATQTLSPTAWRLDSRCLLQGRGNGGQSMQHCQALIADFDRNCGD